MTNVLADPRKQTTVILLRDRPLRLVWSLWPALGEGPTWIFIHGMGSSRWAFADLLAQRPVPGQYLAVDLPGFGDSQLPPFVQTLDDFRDAVHQLIQQLHLRQPILVGHSFGGMVAGRVVSDFPSDVGGLVLVASAGYFPPENAMKTLPWTWLNRIGIWITSFDFYGDRMLQALGLNPSEIPPSTRERMRYGWRRAKEMARMREFYPAPNFVEHIFQSTVPTVAIHGDRDILFPLPKVREAIGSAFPLLVLQGAGHLPYDYDLDGFIVLLNEAYQRIRHEANKS